MSRPGGEGLILLAHHGEGAIWFEAGNKIALGTLKRSFPPGSVAMLSACRLGDPHVNNATIIDVLNKRGIEAAIISPFKIDAQYGVALATQFARVVYQQLGTGRSAATEREEAKNTLVDLFHEAVEAAGKSMAQPVSEMGLEFLIIGNHMLELCGG